jgi:hypothetical protein
MGKNCEVREIIGLMFVGNEDDILEPCIRHNIRYLDRLTVVLDSKSVDDSLRIVTNLIAEGLPIDLISQAVHLNLDFRNDFVKKNNAWAYVFIDDDEFIFGVQPELLRKYIFECESSKYIALPWKTFIINPNDYDCSDIPRSLKYARKFEDPQYFKVIYIKGESEITHKIGAGAHIVDGLTGISFRDLFLAHYPVRSAKQITLKYFASSLDYRLLLRDKLPEGHGWHLRSGFEKMINEDFMSLESLFKESMAYASTKESFTHDDFQILKLDFCYIRTTKVMDQNIIQLVAKMINAIAPFVKAI